MDKVQLLQEQIDNINRKLDLLIEESMVQRAKRQSAEDLMDDLNLIGKDAFNTTVRELDKAGIDIDPEIISKLGLKILYNIETFSRMIERLESLNDFIKDAEPILRQMGLDAINKIAEFEKKGYLQYLNSIANLGKTVMSNYSADDINKLSQNIAVIFRILKNITDADLLLKLENITLSLKNIEMNPKTDNKSLFRILRDFNSPETRMTLSYLLRLIKEINTK